MKKETKKEVRKIHVGDLVDRIKENIKENKETYKLDKINKNDIKGVINQLLTEIDEALVKGEKVDFIGHFSLFTTEQKAKVAMNLQTKQKMNIPAKRVPKVKFSSGLKMRIGNE